MIYPPKEDSLLLQKWVRKLARGSVLDMGTGSGVQAETAAKQKRVKSVVAADVNPEVIAHCKKRIVAKKIKCLKTDLFSRVKGQFDTIIFNPPYLPQELPERDIALEGGKRGFETLVAFLEQSNPHLKTDGTMLILFSSLTKKNKIEETLKQQLFDFKELGRIHIFFEDLFVYKVTKSALLKKVEKTGVKEISYFARGKRSWVYQGIYRNKKCIVKVKRPDSAANSPAKEGKMLKVVNKLGLGPKLFTAKSDFVVYEFIKGEYLMHVLRKSSKKQKKTLFRQLFKKAFTLDQAGLAKEEMSRPLKNAIVKSSGKIVLIDFERTHKTANPHNVTQLTMFAARNGIASLKVIKHWAAHYHRNPTRGNFLALVDGIGL